MRKLSPFILFVRTHCTVIALNKMLRRDIKYALSYKLLKLCNCLMQLHLFNVVQVSILWDHNP